MSGTVTAIIVTHNSDNVLERCVKCLEKQSYPVDILIVDSGSRKKRYLERLKSPGLDIIFEKNIGFSRGNNIGFSKISPSCEYVLFLNPDTFLDDLFVQKAKQKLKDNKEVGIVSGRLLGFDPGKNKETGNIDSTGIFRKIYGRWYDRGGGETDSGQYLQEESVPAICGALMFCRVEALKSSSPGDDVFDPEFFLYKEDIELSLRIRKRGWKLLYSPKLVAYHCRGWQARKTVPYHLRLMSAKNEIMLYKKHPSPYIVWALVKYWLVVLFHL